MALLAPYTNPYTSAIVDTMGQPAAAQGAALQTGAAASARAWTGVGNAAVQTLGDFLKWKEGAPRRALETQQLASGKLDLEQKERFKAFQTALGKSMQDTPHGDENGVSVYDIPSISKAMTEQGYGDMTGEVVKHLGSVNDAFRAERAAKLVVSREGAQALARAGNDPAMANSFLDLLEKNGTITKELANTYRAAIVEDPESVARLTAYYGGPHKYGTAAPGSRVLDETTGQLVPGESVPERKPDYTIGDQRYNGSTGAKIGTAAPPKVGSREDFLGRVAKEAGKKVDDLTTAEIDEADKRHATAVHVTGLSVMTPEGRARLVAAVMANPDSFRDLTETDRSAIIPDLADAGFTGFERNPSEAARAERWRTTEIQKVNKAFAEGQILGVGNGGMSVEERDRQLAAIEASYAKQTKKPAAVKPKAPPPPDKTVTLADLQKIATRNGTTVDQERQRAIGAGYAVVR